MTNVVAPLLRIEGLSVGFPETGHSIIEDLSLSIGRGEVVALVGESGSGKSMTALSLMRLLPAGAEITGGTMTFGEDDLVRVSERRMRQIRGGKLAMLFQQPQAMLDPTARIGGQIAEPLRLHRGLGREAAMERVGALLGDLGISEPQERARAYAHQVSGGMAQRMMMAAALSGDPDLLIADEPTTALDVTIQAQILRLLDAERRKRGMAVLLITHDLSIVSALAERVAVMYAGRLVEEGPTETILNRPQHPYTQALVRCSLLQTDESGTLFSIPAGTPGGDRKGCRFRSRCTMMDACGVGAQCAHAEPALHVHHSGCCVRCWAVETGALAHGHGHGHEHEHGHGAPSSHAVSGGTQP
jgi:peptide/nickel transport system ATP-binding protein